MNENWGRIGAGVLLGCLVWVLLPGMVVALDDDFWYLRSAIQTFQKGRPWTDSWLTPWGASSSVVTALLFGVTGSFTMAVHLPLALSAGAGSAGMFGFLRACGVNKVPALTIAMLVLGTPTVLFMFLMYTSVAVYMGCLWVCVWLAKQGRWWGFLVVWGVALSGRQSAIVWLALPGMELLGLMVRRGVDWRGADGREMRRLVMVLLLAGAWLGLLLWGMNPTRGQGQVLGDVTLESLGEMVPTVVMGLLAGSVGLGLASVGRVLRGMAAKAWSSGRLFGAIGMAVLAAGTMVWFVGATLDTHDCFRDPWTCWVLGGVAAGIVGCLAWSPPRVHWGCLAAGAGSLVLVALYRGRFDYYFVDALFFGIASGFWHHRERGVVEFRGGEGGWGKWRKVREWSGRVVVGLLVIWTVRSWVRLAVDQNRTAALIQMYEEAFDAGLLEVEEVGTAPFGYLGWLLIDCYDARLEGKGGDIAGFLSLCRGWDGVKGTGVLMSYPKPLNRWRELLPTRNSTALKKAEGRVVLEKDYPILGSLEARFELKQVEAAGEVREGGRRRCGRVRFPLNDEEWRQFIFAKEPIF